MALGHAALYGRDYSPSEVFRVTVHPTKLSSVHLCRNALSAVSKPMVGQVLGWRDGALAAHAGQHVAVGVEGDDDGGVPK